LSEIVAMLLPARQSPPAAEAQAMPQRAYRRQPRRREKGVHSTVAERRECAAGHAATQEG